MTDVRFFVIINKDIFGCFAASGGGRGNIDRMITDYIKKNWLIVVGIIMVAAATLLTAYNIWDDNRAAGTAKRMLVRLDEAGAKPSDELAIRPETRLPDYVLDPSTPMTEVEVDGGKCVGVIEIPAIDRYLPVLSEWSESASKISPCRYSGSVYSGDMVIAGHNYRSHFGPLSRLKEGDKLYFRDMRGNIFTYEVALTETVRATDIEYMTGGGWDLTLFTCTNGGRARFALRCRFSE